jgi:hypothetical protein
MALKLKYKARDELPAEAAGLYVERDGAWVLDVEGGLVDPAVVAEERRADKAKVEEFRANVVAVTRELEDLKKRFEGIDPEEVQKLAEEKQRLLEEQQIKAGEVEKVVESRVKGLKGEWEKQVSSLTSERDALNTRLTAIQIDQGVVGVATRRGLRPTAIADITARARSVFKLVNGAPRAFEGDGATVRYGRDGVTPMSVEEWVDTQVSEAPHLFEANVGGGASARSSGGGQGAIKNPFRKESWNLTEQMRLAKSDPALAARLKTAC